MNKAFSLYLDLVRFLAALAVLLFHASGFDSMHVDTGLGRYSREAVIVFFVLSGFVIAYTTDKKDITLAEYAIHRISRIYSVVLPALLLTVLVDGFGISMNPTLYVGLDAQTLWPVRLIISVLCLNEWGFWSVQFFSNVPYWSISYEVGYYILFGIAFLLTGPMRWLLLLFVGLVIGPRILLLLPIWMLGVWVYQSRRLALISRKTAAVAIMASAVGWVVVVDGGWARPISNELSDLIGVELWRKGLGWSRFFLTDYLVGIIVAVNFCAVRVMVADAKVTSARLMRFIRLLSLLTFPLYLFHQPLILFFASLSPSRMSNAGRLISVLVSTLIVVATLTPLCEYLRILMRRFLANLLQRAKIRRSMNAALEAAKAVE
jgi:peptidoglycan/LPS O-acetylase OafA/YrhL